MVQEHKIGHIHRQLVPGQRGEDGQIIATSGLLTTITGRLVVRRVGQSHQTYGWQATGEEASYIEWASFIRSVQGTLEEFTFEHGPFHFRSWTRDSGVLCFQPCLGNWPCLTIVELLGRKGSSDEDEKAVLTVN